jgi:phospholipid/cholesterol/gamma-HCH transport system permease protein
LPPNWDPCGFQSRLTLLSRWDLIQSDIWCYLALWRVSFPMLYMFAASFGIGGGLLAGIVTGGVSAADYMNGAKEYFYAWDVVFGIIKAFVFGFVITSIACYKGYNASGGAEGVGKATTAATVLGCVYVLVSDLILSAILL